MKETPGIYRIVVQRPEKEPLFYIGHSIRPRERWTQHLRSLRRGDHDNRQMLAAFRKYGPGAFSVSTILICSPEAAILVMYEQAILNFYRSQFGDIRIMNAMKECVTSHIGIKRSAETIRRMSESQKGRKKTPEQIARVSAALTGLKRSPEVCHRQSERMKNRPAHPNFLAAKPWAEPKRLENLRKALAGKPKIHTPETILKITISLTGRTQTDETNAKRSATLRGRKHSSEHIAKRVASRAAKWRAQRSPEVGC